MPEITRFYGIIIKMLFSDNSQHNKPHIYVFYGEYDATIALDGELLAGNFPIKQLKLVQAWIVLHEEELYGAWNNAVRNLPFNEIKPLN